MKCMYCGNGKNVQNVDNGYILLCEKCIDNGVYEIVNMKQTTERLSKKVIEVMMRIISTTNDKKSIDTQQFSILQENLNLIKENIKEIEELIPAIKLL